MSDNTWFLLQQGAMPPAYNMALDEALMECAPARGWPVLRFYGWDEPAATFGYSQHYEDIARWTMLRPLVRRPTGGGLVPHDVDWTYSIAVPPAHPWYELKATESYRRVHEWIRDAFARIDIPTTLAPEPVQEAPGQCFIGAERFDVLWHRKKIAGAAQRRTRAGLLVQGSVQPPPIPVSREAWQTAMIEVASAQWNVRWQNLEVADVLEKTTHALIAGKYSQDSFNRKR